MSKPLEVCVACDHSIHDHFQDVVGSVRCLHSESGITTGVVMSYYSRCDCSDYKSEQGNRRHTEEQRKKEASERLVRELREGGSQVPHEG